MRRKQFYDHLVDIEYIRLELDSLEIRDHEKKHLIEIIHINVHATILDTVLSHLLPEDKSKFLEHLENEDHNVTLSFLQKRIAKIEEIIKKASNQLLKEFHDDIIGSKKGKKNNV